MATVSLRVAHQRTCAQATRTSIGSLEGCTCKPSYYTFYRDRNGKPVKGSRTRTRRVAERDVAQKQVDLDAGRILRAERNITCAAWVDDHWLPQHRAKPSTLELYRHSAGVAKRAFGSLTLREIEASDIRTFLDLLRSDGEERGRSPTDTTGT